MVTPAVGTQNICDLWDCTPESTVEAQYLTAVQDIEPPGRQWAAADAQLCTMTALVPDHHLEGRFRHFGLVQLGWLACGAGVQPLQQPSLPAPPPFCGLSILCESL